MTDNMKIWNAIEADPKFTKEVKQRGGFTAINAQWVKMKATEMWGPIGGEWGLKDCKYGYVFQGEKPVEAYLEATFFYPSGTIEISTDMTYRAGDDCRTKLRTHAISKATGDLGFCADIYLGTWDDNKYTSQPASQPKATSKASTTTKKPNQNDDGVFIDKDKWEDGQQTKTGTIERVYTKGERMAVKIDEDWFSTFDDSLKAALPQFDGKLATIHYFESNGFQNVTGVEAGKDDTPF